METMGLQLEIPGGRELRLRKALFDLNGTLATDGIVSEDVRKRLRRLREVLALYLVTADTHGTVADLVYGCEDLEIVKIEAGNEAEQKYSVLKELGASQTVALGNGANDVAMLREASLGICVMQGEGTSLQALMASDILVRSAEEALDLLLQPARLLATLRS